MAAETLAPAPGRALAVAPPTRAGIAAVVVLVAIVAAAAALDPSGLLAPVGGQGFPLAGSGGAYRWAPLVVGVPVLIGGTALPVALVARNAVKTRSVFFGTWLAVVAAAVWATAATNAVAAAPMIDSHLSVWATLTFALSTSGFAAVKFLLLGPVVAAATALAYRFGSRTQDAKRPERSTVPIVAMAAIAVLAAFGPALHWWRGGPIGYAFAGFLPAPTAAAGVLGMVVGLAVFLGLFALGVRVLPVLLAATVAGCGLGAVDAVVAALASQRIPDAGPDSWWIATTLLSLAAGIGYGATVGLFGSVVTAVLRGMRIRGLRAGAVVLLLPIAAIGVPAEQEPVTARAVAGTMQPLQLLPNREPGKPAVIGDATGRQVLLRGVNVNQLIDYYLRDASVPATQPLTDDDFAQMAAMGFNVIRLGMSWSRLEPQRGTWDESYLRQIQDAVAKAKAHNIYTVLDMHEDAWGNALAQPTAKCPGGTSPTTGWDGAPAWATITDGTAHCQFLARDLAPAVATAFANFATDRDGIQTELVRTWAFVAEAFADEPAVAGYDLLNEPGIGANPPISSGLLLGRYYDAAISAIRDRERITGGYAHLAFFEPSVLWSGLGFDVTPPPGFTGDRQIVFAPHSYSESISMDQSFGMTIASIERNLAVSADAAAAYGAGLWIGEWGWFGDPDADGAKVQRFVAAQDRLGIGGAFWVWRQGCGSPETGTDALTSGNLVRVDCRTGASIAPPAGFAQPLSRAYPRALPGRLKSLNGSSGLHIAAAAGPDTADCTVDLWIPGQARPTVTATGVESIAYQQVPGGWQVTGCARGTYTIAG